MNPDDIMIKQLEQMEKERQDKETKLKSQFKKVGLKHDSLGVTSRLKVDYMERAKRLVEIPLQEAYYKNQIAKDSKFHEEQEEERVRRVRSSIHATHNLCVGH